MNISINNKLFETFPETHIAILKVCNFKNENLSSIDILRASEKYVIDNYTQPILELPEIQTWRTAYKTLGVKKGTRVSVESLIKRVSKGNQLPDINPLVNLYNSISLKHIFPCGGEDLNTIQGDIHLTYAIGNETFKTIGSDENEPPTENEVVYKDDLGCLCRCWNWREADRTKLTDNTTNALLVIESLTTARVDELKHAVEALAELIHSHLGGELDYRILSKENPTWSTS